MRTPGLSTTSAVMTHFNSSLAFPSSSCVPVIAPLTTPPQQTTIPIVAPTVSSPPLRLRPYQQRILDTALQANTLIILPTGSGKTLIAAEAIRHLPCPALFLVPTVLLVKQQSAALRSQLSHLTIATLHGGSRPKTAWHVLVATPAAFHAAMLAANTPKWHQFGVIVFDEVHHMLKKHPYRTLALSLKSSAAKPRVLALTASFTYAVRLEEASERLSSLCEELNLQRVENAHMSELRRDGCHANAAAPLHPPIQIQHLCVPSGVLNKQHRQPHLMLATFLQRCEDGSATSVARAAWRVILAMEYALFVHDGFESQTDCVTNIRKWSVNAYRRAVHNTTDDVMKRRYEQLCHWYEAIRILVVSWEEDEFACVWYLKMTQCNHVLSYQHIWRGCDQVCECIGTFWGVAPTSFVRLQVLKQVLLQQQRQLALSARKFRGIIFVQQRISTHVLQHYVQTEAQLSKLFQVGCIYAHSSSATPMLSVSKTQMARTLERFASGNINLLVATSVAEEGMDIPAANCVIRFDEVHSTVSFVQGRGRAREQNSCLVVLKQRDDRSSATFMEVEREQLELLRDRMA
eukprot:TRINITY_DN185_c0_g1_i2.p1 TRINITY_DN185_c0_g1~~TRINITY_DN185_c0_g1_i2.p1  ORF type:complete len:575 (+),score=94.75 TRINITY_DN185_c0_g1_i2:4379-6103(+)